MTQPSLIAHSAIDALTWITSLCNEKYAILDSSTDLVQEIEKRQQKRQQEGYTGPAKTPKIVPGLTGQVKVKPIDLLHSIGRITTPIVPILPDLSSTWAFYRYIWAFDARKNNLCLSPFAKDIDFHQKALLSDEVGVGMTHWLMTNCFGATIFIDVDVALRNPKLCRQLGIPQVLQKFKTSPDYISSLPNGEYAVVECKGSQSGKSTSMNQVRRGLEQVTSVTFASGQAAQEYVVATLLSTKETVVHVVDPPAALSEDRRESDESESESTKRKIIIGDKDAFDQNMRRLHAANLLAFAGAWRQALNVGSIRIPEEYPVREEPLEEIMIYEVDAAFRGRSFTLPFRGSVESDLFVCQGLAEDTYTSISEERFLESEIRAFPEPRYWQWLQRSGELEAKNVVSFVGESEETVYSFYRDGSFLRLSLA